MLAILNTTFDFKKRNSNLKSKPATITSTGMENN